MNALSFEDVLDKLIELDEEIKELKAYYEGPAWREDYETDLNDLFPANLKRGILAEDILYDLLAEVEQVLEEKIPTINPGDKDED